MAAGKEVQEAIRNQIPNAKVDALELDLSSIASVTDFASNFKGLGLPLNLLMNYGNPLHAIQRQHRAAICNESYWYNSLSAYGQSKLANILHANELARQLKDEGIKITANSLNPGVIATDLFRHHPFVEGFVNALGKHVMKNVQQGAATTCYVALHPSIKDVTGSYFADCNISDASSQANDTELAKKLWNLSLALIHRSKSLRLSNMQKAVLAVKNPRK